MLHTIAHFIERHQRWFGYPLVVAMSIGAFLLAIGQPRFLELVELKTLDVRFELRGHMQPDPRIVIVAVDDASLNEIGRWPWSRDKIGVIVDQVLGKYGARVIGFDIVFSEAQANPLRESLRLLKGAGKTKKEIVSWLNRHQKLGDIDTALAAKLDRYRDRIVLGYFFYTADANIPERVRAKLKQQATYLQPSAATAEFIGESRGALVQIGAIEGNLPKYSQAADAMGFFNFFPDQDGLVRRVPLVAELDGYIFPNLDLQILRVALDWPQLSVQIGKAGVEEIRLGNRLIHTGPDGQLLLNHYGPVGTFRHVSAADVLKGRADPALFKDAIVLLGATAVGIFDYRPIPYDTVFAGVEAHAATLANILNGQEIKRPLVLKVSELMAVLLLSLLFGCLVHRRGAIVQSLSILGVPVLITLIALWLFTRYGLWLKETYLIVGVLMATLPTTLIEYIVVTRKRAFIHEAFSHYLAPKVVEELANHPETLRLGGEEDVLTAMFSDIAAFSAFSERLQPEELVHFLNLYLSAMSDIILERGGTIDKYEGDAIIAFFGAPVEMPDHALRCVTAALEQQQILKKLRPEWLKTGYPDVHVRIGINTGPMVVGNMGTEGRMNYTIMGDHVNLASRLEGVNKVYGTPILISRHTYFLVRDQIEARFIDRVCVMGRKVPVDIYQPLGERGKVPRDELSLARSYGRAWRMMRARKFEKAVNAFERILSDYPEDGPSKVLLRRVKMFAKKPPPEDWECVYLLKTK